MLNAHDDDDNDDDGYKVGNFSLFIFQFVFGLCHCKYLNKIHWSCTVYGQQPIAKIGIENLSRNSSVNYCFKSISICQKSKAIWNYINECYKRICFDANCWAPTTWAAFSVSISFARYLIGTYCWLETFEMNATTRHFIFCHVNTQSECDCKPRRPNKQTGARTPTLSLTLLLYLSCNTLP